MPLTVEDFKLKSMFVNFPDGYEERGNCFLLRPPVKVINKFSECSLVAQMIDMGGLNPNTFKAIDHDFWFPVNAFEFADPTPE